MIENVLDIAAPAETVFDFVVDVQSEPRWNPQILHAGMLSRAHRSGHHIPRQVRSRRRGRADQRHQTKALLEMGL